MRLTFAMGYLFQKVFFFILVFKCWWINKKKQDVAENNDINDDENYQTSSTLRQSNSTLTRTRSANDKKSSSFCFSCIKEEATIELGISYKKRLLLFV